MGYRVVAGMIYPEVPHFARPFRIVAGAAKVHEQDSIEEIQDCVEAVLRTTRGEREYRPEFGIRDHALEEAGDTLEVDVREAIEEHEPRASALVQDDPSQLDDLVMKVRVSMEDTNG